MAAALYLIVLLFGAVAFAIPGASMTQRRGHGPWLGALLGGALWLLGLMIISVIPPNRTAIAERIEGEATESRARTERLQSALGASDQSLADPWERETYG